MTDLGTAAKQALLTIVDRTADRSEQKERIMIAWEEGVLWPDEAEALIRKYGLKLA